MKVTTQCPKCHYRRTHADGHVHIGTCPSCGIAYAKWQPKQDQGSAPNETYTEENADNIAPSIFERLKTTLTYVSDKVDPLGFWGRVGLLLVFALWGCSFIWSGVDWESIGGSFLHSVNLPFHEFGHVLFSPFGRFMAILGGSLFQIMMPLIAMVSFSVQMRDNFAAAIMLWWCGQNFIDVAPYIADAKYRALPLILGMGEEAHDWGNLLTMLNRVESAHTYANLSFTVGTLIILLGLYWAAYLLWQQKKHLDSA